MLIYCLIYSAFLFYVIFFFSTMTPFYWLVFASIWLMCGMGIRNELRPKVTIKYDIPMQQITSHINSTKKTKKSNKGKLLKLHQKRSDSNRNS